MSDGALQIDLLTGEIFEHEQLFRRLLDAAWPGAPFQTHAWISSWWKSNSEGRQARVLVARAAGEPIGILPLYETPTLGGKTLRLMGDLDVGSDYLGAITSAKSRGRVSDAFAAHIEQLEWDALEFDNLLRDDPLSTALAERGAIIERRYRCPRVRIAGTFDQYLRARPNGAGAQWRRRLRWLEKREGFSIACHTSAENVALAMSELFALHDARWALDDGSEGFTAPWVYDFHRTVASRLADDAWVRLYVLSVGGAPRAALYGFSHADRFAFFQAGHDPMWRARSVGTVLLGHVIERCFSEGLAEFDFLHGDESYKFDWANDARELVRVRRERASVRTLFSSAGRALYDRCKRLVPASALRFARRAKKRVRHVGAAK